MTTTQEHCPGFQAHKYLKVFKCSCPECDKEIEIFSDEIDKTHKCDGCGTAVDIAKCDLED